MFVYLMISGLSTDVNESQMTHPPEISSSSVESPISEHISNDQQKIANTESKSQQMKEIKEEKPTPPPPPPSEPFKCYGAHTRETWGKKCVCEEGYFGTEEDIRTVGCYTCSKKCHPAAKCIMQDVCKCNNGLIGDGTVCEMPEPKIKQIIQPFPNQLAPVPVLVEYDAPSFIPYHAFCKINSKTVPAMIYSNSTIACLSPDKQRGDASLSISYDGVKYSQSQSYKIVPGIIEPPKPAIHLGIQPESNFWLIPSIIIIIIAFCGIAYFILHVFNGKREKMFSVEERQPLVSNRLPAGNVDVPSRKRDI